MDGDVSPASSAQSPGSDELLRAIIESASEFAILAQDPAGIVISWNKGAERLLGFSSEEIVGQSGDIVFTPDDRAAGIPAQERADASARGRSVDERWHVRKDGSRFWGSGLLMPLTGDVRGFVKILRDRTREREADLRLRESEERFRMLATHIPQLVFRSEGSGARTWGSPQWEIYAGLSDRESRFFGWLDAIHPDDVAVTLAQWETAQASGEYYVEHRIRRAANGEYRWHQTRARPLNRIDRASDWVGTSADIHDLRELQGRQQVFVAELQHRTRNLLAVVQSIERQTLRKSATLDDFAVEFESRLGALSRVQSQLAATDFETVDLGTLIRDELEAHGDGQAADPRKVRIDGPPVKLRANAAQALALALHELATNAVKYGALAQPPAALRVAWTIAQRDDKTWLRLDWRETDVAMDQTGEPRRRGYGSELIERALPYQLKAETILQFTPSGVHCSIAVAIAAAKKEEDRG